MSDFITSNSLLMLERAMRFQWSKQRAISDNVTNADTPGYKAKYVTFEEALRQNLQVAARGQSPLSTIRGTLRSAAPVVHVADDETFRMDGNGVNIATEQLELVRSAYQTQHLYRAYSSDISRLLMAIRGQ